MGSISIADALDSIKSNSAPANKEGLADLKRVFDQAEGQAKLKDLTDRAWSGIFDSLFRLASAERTKYQRTSKTAQERAAARLAECAAVFRQAVALSVRRLRYKTVRAIFDHVLQVLPGDHDFFCAPISHHYLKAVRNLLSYGPHVEHLSSEEWTQLVQFCGAGIQALLSDISDVNPTHSAMSNGDWTPVTQSNSFESSRKTFAESYSASPRQQVEELLGSLQHLLATYHAPIVDEAQTLGPIINSFLESAVPAKQVRSQELAFSCIQSMLSFSATEDISLCQSLMGQLLVQFRRLYHAKIPSSLREAMFGAFVMGEAFIPALVRNQSSVTSDLQRLAIILRDEYHSRSAKDVLNLQDLSINPPHSSGIMPPKDGVEAWLSPTSSRAEHAWFLLYIIAVISQHQQTASTDQFLLHASTSDGPPRKRRKFGDQDMHGLDHSGAVPALQCIMALQETCFVVSFGSLPDSNLAEILQSVVKLLSSANVQIVNWALLVMSSAIRFCQSPLQQLVDIWEQAWQASMRALRLPSQCRAACDLLCAILHKSILPEQSIAGSLSKMIASIESNCPAILCDTAVDFWQEATKAAASSNVLNLGKAKSACLDWLMMKWKSGHPENWRTDSVRTLSLMLHTTMIALTSNLLTSRSRICRPGTSLTIASIISRRQRTSVQYLLNETWHGSDQSLAETTGSVPNPDAISVSVQPLDQCESFIHFLLLQSESILQLRDTSESEISQSVEHLVDNIIALLMAVTWCAYSFDSRLKTSMMALDDASNRLVKALQGMRQSSFYPKLAETVVASLADYLFPKSQMASKDPSCAAAEAIVQKLGSNFWQSVQPLADDIVSLDNAESQQDELFLSESHSWEESASIDLPRSSLAVDLDALTTQVTLSTKVHLISSYKPGATSSDPTSLEDAALENVLRTLPAADFIRCKHLWIELLTDPTFADASSLLRILGENVLPQYEFQRCEAALEMCLDILSASVNAWATSDGEIADLASQLYSWFINVLFSRGFATPELQMKMTRLISRIIEHQLKPQAEPDAPSPASSLMKLLEVGTAGMRIGTFRVLGVLFDRTELREHERLLDDLLEHLPINTDWCEGTGARVKILGFLAGKYTTLTRKALFAILESSTAVPAVKDLAAREIAGISKALHLKTPQSLFQLFAAQVLFSWLERSSIATLPHSLFGYENLKFMLQDVSGEVTAQVMMRGSDNEAEELATLLAQPFLSLVQAAFGKSAAYCIGYDAVTPPESDATEVRAVLRLWKILGKEKVKALVTERLPEIVSTFFEAMDREVSISKGLKRHHTYAPSLTVLEEIVSYGCTPDPLTAGQQPSFKASCLPDEIQYVWSRSAYSKVPVWSPCLFVFVFRQILGSAQPALGPVYAASAIRRVRILVALAGDIVTQEYPLQTALHSLGQYLTNVQCTEDVIGLLQFLLTHGAKYLQLVPAFFVSHLISMSIYLGEVSNTPQQSGSPTSQFESASKAVNAFHKFLSAYAISYVPDLWDKNLQQAYNRICEAVGLKQVEGSQEASPSPDKLLQVLLDDDVYKRHWIDEPTKTLILQHMTRRSAFSFQSLVQNRASIDINRADASAAWATLGKCSVKGAYVSYVARMMGRAYRSDGHMIPSLTHEMTSCLNSSVMAHRLHEPGAESSLALLLLIQGLASSPDQVQIQLAEQALRKVTLGALADTSLHEALSCLPNSCRAALTWTPFQPPQSDLHRPRDDDLTKAGLEAVVPSVDWIKKLTTFLAQQSSNTLLGALVPLLHSSDDLATQFLPFIFHLALLEDVAVQEIREWLSMQIKAWFANFDASSASSAKHVLGAIVYLRTQPRPRELTQADRMRWLSIDLESAANVASHCKMFKTALLFLELHASEAARGRQSRRSKSTQSPQALQTLIHVYENIDDKDLYYGLEQPSTLQAVCTQLSFEEDPLRSLSFNSAARNSELKRRQPASKAAETGMIQALNDLSLTALTQTMLLTTQDSFVQPSNITYETARKLERWDIASSSHVKDPASVIFTMFQNLHETDSLEGLKLRLNQAFEDTVSILKDQSSISAALATQTLGALAVLSDIETVVFCQGDNDLQRAWNDMVAHSSWMNTASREKTALVSSCRTTLFGMLRKQNKLREIFGVSDAKSRVLEVEALLAASRLDRMQSNPGSALDTTTYAADLVPSCAQVGLNLEIAVQKEVSNVLWDQEQNYPSIEVLQNTLGHSKFDRQSIAVGRAEILALLGHRIAEARLERPDEIIEQFLRPAISELKDQKEGRETGFVFHEFAAFCDTQLRNNDDLEDFRRIAMLRERKSDEVRDLDAMITSSASRAESQDHRDRLQRARTAARKWFDLDDAEYQRLSQGRQALVLRSLENYLRCLRASDIYDQQDVLRFAALWLEYHDEEKANVIVSRLIAKVPSHKFASLMNQWTARMLDDPTPFQGTLHKLVLRICSDHPFHGMHHLFATSKSAGTPDPSAESRQRAAVRMGSRFLSGDGNTRRHWTNIHNADVHFVAFAKGKNGKGKVKQWSRVPLKDTKEGKQMIEDAKLNKVTPPTLHIPLRPDCNYDNVPSIAAYHTDFTVAPGISAPKILTAVTTDGHKSKQLFKAGHDDLRQDAIMEQVFQQVSNLLKTHRNARQRHLGVRTYAVVPLTTTAGIIEFVSNTIPLNDYLMPAHERYFPQDYKPSVCRKHIQEAHPQSTNARLQVFRQVCERFHPVLHYFFMEKFPGPDEWFQRRLAYTRSTAVISMLGWVLGLGDRHGHNILLDEKTGEVVHIDLGIAFEQGRVSPIPELIPFRLTRDIVDGMGITKTKGVFQRCCEFTLTALRAETDSIMTILDVLRYDPLYTWSISPVRLQRLQQQAQQAQQPDPDTSDEPAATTSQPATERRPGTALVAQAPARRDVEEGEADRALTVVRKKLSKTLSVTATVNELIQAATDERNLALLFAGWAAYA